MARIREIREQYDWATADRKVFTAIRKESLRAVAEHWHRILFPKHFRAGAAKEYRYKPRKRSTLRRKRLQGVAPLPLVTKRGQLQKLTRRVAKIGGSARRVHVSIAVPRQLTPQYRLELFGTATRASMSAADRKAMNVVLDREVQARIDSYKGLEREVLG